MSLHALQLSTHNLYHHSIKILCEFIYKYHSYSVKFLCILVFMIVCSKYFQVLPSKKLPVVHHFLPWAIFFFNFLFLFVLPMLLNLFLMLFFPSFSSFFFKFTFFKYILTWDPIKKILDLFFCLFFWFPPTCEIETHLLDCH